jgi:hypothetical protein
MRRILQKIGALVLALGALTALLAQAALTHGCGGSPQRSEPQAPAAGSTAPAPAPDEPASYEDKDYMGATKAPPLDAFRRSPKSSAGGEPDETEDARDGAQQQAP